MASDIQRPTNQSRYGLIYVPLSCGIALFSAILISESLLGWNLSSHPVKAIGILWAVQGPVVILVYSRIRLNAQTCSKMWAIGRGLLSFPIGALVNAFGAIVFGAPLGLEYAARTLHWSLFMSSLTVVPAATVFGASWQDWQRVFAHIKLLGGIDYALCLPAYGALIGAWFGAWPMPLDWERPWQVDEHVEGYAAQFSRIWTIRSTWRLPTLILFLSQIIEWPICVTYGTIGGYFLGLTTSGIAGVLSSRWVSGKED